MPPGLQISAEELRAQLPQPFLPQRPAWLRLYWRAWELSARMLRHGNAANGFALLFIDPAFDTTITQFDTCMAAAFARYSAELLPVLPTLDSFYQRQERDGYIARAYRQANGAALWPKPSADSTAPPLFAWAEWLLFQVHGRRERLLAVWPALTRYDHWLRTARQLPNGLFWSSSAGAGMPGSPRAAVAWCDLALQQALNALALACIAQALGDDEGAARYQYQHATLAGQINLLMWDEAQGLYCDLDADAQPLPPTTLAPFWALLAEAAPPARAARLAAHLHDPATFWRAHPFPSLAADQPGYDPAAAWQGAVHAPTTYMAISGLRAAGFHDQAQAATARHLDAMAAVLDATGTIWECYHAEEAAPARAARPDFVGWSGLGPIALLIEQILGLELDADAAQLSWRVSEPGPHGIDNLPLGGDRIGLRIDDNGNLQVACGRPLRLLLTGRHQASLDIPTGGADLLLA